MSVWTRDAAVPRRGELPRAVTIVVATCRVACGAVCLATTTGWWIGAESLVRLAPGLPSMKLNTALALMLILLASLMRRAAVVPAAVAAGVGLITIAEYALPGGSPIDQVLVTEHGAFRYPGRMAALTALTLVLLAVAVVWTGSGRARGGRRCAIAATTLSALLVLAWAYDLPSLAGSRMLWAVAPQEAVATLLLSIAVLLPATDTASWSPDDDPGALLTRRLLPVALVGLPALGFASLLGERAIGYGTNATAAITVVSSALLVGAVALLAGRRATRSARSSRQAVADLTALRVDLERQAAERADQLQRRTSAIALLEDRQRIAADLHDVVIQRLFAAGMFLQSASSADAAMRDRVDATVQAMDAAIRDLRASIFDLGSGDVRPTLTDAIAAICTDSEPILGFTPHFVVDDPDGAAERVSDDVLAVVREGLANVARHAAATRATVVLRADDDAITLTVTDDGAGMADVARRSGTGNLRSRAREHGGECTWLDVLPTGTELRWRVPVTSTALAQQALISGPYR